jgi:hypothetical protein
MNIYLPREEPEDDYTFIRRNGMWYQYWQAGYSDILKKGYSKPKDKHTILAELYSPKIDDFLHGGICDVPFLISEKTRKVFEQCNFTGYRLAKVEIVKIATKGKRKRRIKSGEPEDIVMKASNKSKEVILPKLYAVWVTGRVEVIPDYPSGKAPDRGASPFEIPDKLLEIPDLFRPTYNNKTLGGWTFCSEYFRTSILKAKCSNITFQPFVEFIQNFRREIQEKGT